jgi:hypothetical protein
MARFYDEKEKAIRVNAFYEDFDGDIERWKDSFYQLWRIQLTWEIAYSINLRETRSRGVYIDLLIKPAYKEQLLESMDDFGYKNIQTEETNIAFLSTYDRKELADIEDIYLDY